ncbi:PAS domain S-box protein [bacterium]
MNDERKTKAQLIDEIQLLRKELGQIKQQKSQRELEESRNAALNLLEDLQNEIYDRKLIEKQLRETETRNRLLLDHAGVGIGYWDLNGNLLMFNPQAAKNMNGDPDDFSGMNMKDLFGEEIASIYLSRIRKAAKTVKAVTYEDRVSVGAGEKWFSSQYNRILDDEGRVAGVMIIASDISERKKTEENLIKSEDRLSAFMNSATDSFYLFDSTFKMVEMNQSGLKLLGKSREAVIGKHMTDIMPDIESSGRLNNYKRVLKTGKSHEIENFVPHPMSNDRYFKIKSFKVGDGLGVIATDITQQKNVENALIESERRLRSLIEDSPYSVFCYEYTPPISVDMPLKKQVKRLYNGILLECNDVCAQSYGAKKSSDVIGKELVENFGTKPGSLDSFFKDFINNHYRSINQEGVEILTDGSKRYYLNNAHGVIEDGKLIRIWGMYRDITDMKLAEMALQESEDKYKQLFNSANDVVFMHQYTNKGLPGPFIEVNDTAIQVLGYSKEELLKCTPMDIIAPENKENVKIDAQMILEKKQGLFKRILVTKQGNPIPVEIHTTLFNYQGEPTALSICRDISEREKEKKLIIESEKRFRDLSELLPQTVFEMDLEGNLIYINKHGLKVFGYSQAEFRNGINLSQILPPDEMQRGLKQMQQMLQGKGKTGNEYQANKKDGVLIDIMVYNTPVFQNDKHVGWRGTVLDITKHLQMEKALRASEEKYRLLLESANEGLVVINKKGVQYVNPKLVDLLEYSEKEIKSMPFTKFLFPEDRKRAAEQVKRRLNGEAIEAISEIRLLTKRGTTKWIENSTVIIDWEGEKAQLNMITDITDRKHVEDALRESEELYRQLFESESDAIFLIENSTGKILAANEAASLMYGYHHGELLNKKNTDLSAEPKKRESVTNTTQINRNNVITIHIRYHKKKDGTVFMVEITGRFFEWQGRSVHIAAIRDITERQKAEEALRHEIEFNKQLAKFPSENPYPVLRIKTDGTILYANEAALPVLEFWKCTLNQRVPKTWQELLTKITETRKKQGIEITVQEHVFLLTFTPIVEAGYVNVYGLDVTSRKRAEQLIQKHREELQHLSSRLLLTQEEERRRLSRELHDEMGQSLTAIKLNIATLQKKADGPISEVFMEVLKETDTLVENLMEEMHHLALELRPSLLDDLGLVPALKWYVKQYAKRCEIKVSLEALNIEERLPAKHETILYRIVQETLTNIAKYAKASRVVIRLQSSNEAVYANIRDNGHGFDVNEIETRSPDQRGIGLVGIQERVAAVDGIVTVKSKPGKGTTVKVVLPLKK